MINFSAVVGSHVAGMTTTINFCTTVATTVTTLSTTIKFYTVETKAVAALTMMIKSCNSVNSIGKNIHGIKVKIFIS